MFSKVVHDKFVYNRRMNLLSNLISNQLSEGERVLDIGCGDGKIDYLIMQKKKVDIHGVDVLVREKTYVPVSEFDGNKLPFADGEFDRFLFVDVLHHIDNPVDILMEAKRVCKKGGIIKDHLREGLFAHFTLKFMDYVGNAHYNVVLPYNYLKKSEWDKMFNELDMKVTKYSDKLSLYPFPFTMVFDRSLHFLANLDKYSGNS